MTYAISIRPNYFAGSLYAPKPYYMTDDMGNPMRFATTEAGEAYLAEYLAVDRGPYRLDNDEYAAPDYVVVKVRHA